MREALTAARADSAAADALFQATLERAMELALARSLEEHEAAMSAAESKALAAQTEAAEARTAADAAIMQLAAAKEEVEAARAETRAAHEAASRRTAEAGTATGAAAIECRALRDQGASSVLHAPLLFAALMTEFSPFRHCSCVAAG